MKDIALEQLQDRYVQTSEYLHSGLGKNTIDKINGIGMLLASQAQKSAHEIEVLKVIHRSLENLKGELEIKRWRR